MFFLLALLSFLILLSSEETRISQNSKFTTKSLQITLKMAYEFPLITFFQITLKMAYEIPLMTFLFAESTMHLTIPLISD